MARQRNILPTRVTLSYVLDWIIIIAIAAAAGGLNFVKPYHRPFSLLDLTISFPYVPEQISTTTLVLVSLVAPAILIVLIVAIFVPGHSVSRTSSRSQLIRLKLWEWERGWAGLALSLAVAFFITQGAKNLFGKPRPDLLARCQPDLANIAKHVVGGYGQDISERWTLVSSKICQATDMAFLDDGFRSFPSGHSSFSWSGLLYLTLFLCSKFAITIPYLPLQPSTADTISVQPQTGHQHLRDSTDETTILPLHHRPHDDESQVGSPKPAPSGLDVDGAADARGPAHASNADHPVSVRNLAASPPTYLIVPAFTPIAVAIYISSTRYAEFYHHGFDVISGSLIGILAAWFSFRWYHLPLSRGQGWAWGARSKERAFGISVGTGGYVSAADRRD